MITKTKEAHERSGGRFIDGREIQQIWRILKNIRSTNSGTLQIRHSANGVFFTATGGAIKTPFKGSISGNFQVTIGAERNNAEYRFRDTITVGLSEENVTNIEILDISGNTSNMHVYYEITVDTAGSVSHTLNGSAQYPTQEQGKVKIILGRADYDSTQSRFDIWTQYHFGDIHIPARFG